MGNSQALVADAVHSFTDGISDIVTLWAIHMMQVRALKDTFFLAPLCHHCQMSHITVFPSPWP
jgi:hypothetical protein